MARASKRLNPGAGLIAFPKLVKPAKNNIKKADDPLEYSAIFCFKKGSPELAKLEAAFDEIIGIDFTNGEADDPDFKFPLKDGDAANKKRVRKNKAPYEFFNDSVYITPFMEADQADPDLYDGQTLLKDRTEGTKLFYSGAHCAPLLNIYTYDNQFSTGCGMRLIGVQFFSHGEKLASGAGGPTDDLLAGGATGSGGTKAAGAAKKTRYASDDDDGDMDFN